MNPCVRAAGADTMERAPEDATQSEFEVTLNRTDLGLPSESPERGSVVSEIETKVQRVLLLRSCGPTSVTARPPKTFLAAAWLIFGGLRTNTGVVRGLRFLRCRLGGRLRSLVFNDVVG